MKLKPLTVTAIVTAVLFVGGYIVWLRHHPPSRIGVWFIAFFSMTAISAGLSCYICFSDWRRPRAKGKKPQC